MIGQQVTRGWCHPRPVRRFAERLLGQQLWCWGRDVEFSGGNLLLQYGFARHREPGAGKDGSTCYRFEDANRRIALWGFGVFYGERRLGGLYINRFDFRPRWGNCDSLATGIHWPEDLPLLFRPKLNRHWRRAHALYRHMLRWIASYERWIRREVGLSYRRTCLEAWPRTLVPAERMAATWELLRNRPWDSDSQESDAMLRKFSIPGRQRRDAS